MGSCLSSKRKVHAKVYQVLIEPFVPKVLIEPFRLAARRPRCASSRYTRPRPLAARPRCTPSRCSPSRARSLAARCPTSLGGSTFVPKVLIEPFVPKVTYKVSVLDEPLLVAASPLQGVSVERLIDVFPLVAEYLASPITALRTLTLTCRQLRQHIFEEGRYTGRGTFSLALAPEVRQYTRAHLTELQKTELAVGPVPIGLMAYPYMLRGCITQGALSWCFDGDACFGLGFDGEAPVTGEPPVLRMPLAAGSVTVKVNAGGRSQRTRVAWEDICVFHRMVFCRRSRSKLHEIGHPLELPQKLEISFHHFSPRGFLPCRGCS